MPKDTCIRCGNVEIVCCDHGFTGNGGPGAHTEPKCFACCHGSEDRLRNDPKPNPVDARKWYFFDVNGKLNWVTQLKVSYIIECNSTNAFISLGNWEPDGFVVSDEYVLHEIRW